MHKKLRLWLMTGSLQHEVTHVTVQRLMAAPKNWEENGVRRIARRYLEEAYPDMLPELQNVAEVKSASELICSLLCIDCTLLLSNKLSVAQLIKEQRQFLDTTKLTLWERLQTENHVDIGWRKAGAAEIGFSHKLVAENYEVALSVSLIERVGEHTVSWTKGELTIEKKFSNGKRRRLFCNLSEAELVDLLSQSPVETWHKYANDAAFS